MSFNSNTIETLESTGDITLITPFLRNKLINLKRQQESLIRVQSGNDIIYLNAQTKAVQLGFMRIVYLPATVNDLNIDHNFNEIILTLESGFIIKNHTEKERLASFKKMLNNLKELKKLLNLEIK